MKNDSPNILVRKITLRAPNTINDKYTNGTFYISVEAKRNWKQLTTNWNDQRIITLIIKLKHILLSNGAEEVNVVDSLEDTRIYFRMNRLTLTSVYSQINNMFHNVSIGEVVMRDSYK